MVENLNQLTTSMPQRKVVWLLVTAHPDDESMFFIPTIRNLLRSPTLTPTPTTPKCEKFAADDASHSRLPQHSLQVLCLSNGDYRDASDGPIRVKEMHRACSIVGVRNDGGGGRDSSSSSAAAAAVTVLDDDRMKDGPNEVWSPDVVSEAVLEHIRRRIVPSVCADIGGSCKPKHDYILSGPKERDQPWVLVNEKKMKKESIDAMKKLHKESIPTINLNILTFDRGGVSGHPNHVDTFRGVQNLLNEKCCISRDQIEPMAKLRLCPEGKENDPSKEPGKNVLEINVSVYLLKTISNPIRKYFLWVFAEMLPFIFVWLYHIVCYMAFFLVGGLLWSKVSPRIQPFSGMKTMHDGKHVQCLIMEPILVWRAMAAHHSQFVWYRRLSVMFSRYTFINDLQKLDIEIPPQEEDEDCDVKSLPPVVVVGEVESSAQFLLSPRQMEALRMALLPPGLHHRPWKRIYSLSRDGDSFVACQKSLEDWARKLEDASTILVVKTVAGDVIGGFADGPLVPMASNFGSALRSCLFKFSPETRGEGSVLDVYGKDYSSSSWKRLVFDATRRIIAFGGGDIDGGLDEGFGLCLEDGFSRGITARCAAFCNEPLVPGQDGVFQVLDVEVWGFVFGHL